MTGKKLEMSNTFDKEGKFVPVTLIKIEEISDISPGDYVDVSGKTKGKGFQGGVKRWNWHGGERGHGSMFHRAPGSIGASSFPSRVFKGQHLPGHMGAVKRTIQNLKVISVDEEKKLLALKGGVPGARGALLSIRPAKKRKNLKVVAKPKE